MPVADKLIYSVVDNKLTIESVQTRRLEGDIFLDGGLVIDQNLSVTKNGNFSGDVKIDSNLAVGGEIRADTIYVEKLIAKTERQLKEPVSWSKDEGGIAGKGLVWKKDKKNVNIFIYQEDPDRLVSNIDIDLWRGTSYKIDGTPVLSDDTLGPSILKSSLRKVGRLKDLIVDGDVIIGEHIFFDSNSGRISFGTDHANAAFSLVDNGVEVVIGNLYEEQGNIGTFTSHDLGLMTDNTTRMKITRTGKIIFGEPKSANADITINGKLFVKELIVDNKIERTSPLEFTCEGKSAYGKGMVFTGDGPNKQFIYASMPDQFYSTEHINIQEGKAYYINRRPVLFEDALGSSVVKSSITSLGTLESLIVAGNVSLNNVFKVTGSVVSIGDLNIDTRHGISFTSSKFDIGTENQKIEITNDRITFGDKNSPTINTVINGKVAIGVQNIGSYAQLEVAGNIRFADKLFMVGSASPTQGTYRKGDIVWNDNPKETGYVGWVCIREGNPGIWRGFGQIGIE